MEHYGNQHYWAPADAILNSTYSGPSQDPITQMETGLEAVPEGYPPFRTTPRGPPPPPPRPPGFGSGVPPPSPLIQPQHRQEPQWGGVDRQPGLETTGMPPNMHLSPHWSQANTRTASIAVLRRAQEMWDQTQAMRPIPAYRPPFNHMSLTPLPSQPSQNGLDSSATETIRCPSPAQVVQKDPTEKIFDFSSDTLGGVESLYESDRVVPSYVVDRFLKQNPRAKGYFCVFQPTFALERDPSIVVDGLLPQSSILKGWKGGCIVGHLFEMTWWGTLRYYGKFREEREKFGKDWESTFGGCTADVTNPTLASLTYVKRHGRTSEMLDLFSKNDSVSDGSYTSSSLYPGSGSFWRLFGEVKASSPATEHLLWIELPRLIAYIISWDMIEVKDILFYIESGYWRGTDSYDRGAISLNLRIPVSTEEWKGNGWSYTERRGMEVLVE